MISLLRTFPLVLLFSLSVQAAVRVALVTTESAPQIEQTVLLAEGELGNDTAIELLDRKNIAKVLTEQKLTLSGLADPAQAIQAGKLLNADVFAVVEVDSNQKKSIGLTVFESRSGVRLWDAAFTGSGIEASAKQIAEGVRTAAGKVGARQAGVQTVGILTVRNADLPRSQDSAVQAIGRLLERQLIQAPGVAVVERDRLRSLLQERNLPTREALPPLLASVSLIELEISRDKTTGLLATARISDPAGKELGTVTFSGRDTFAVVTGLAPKVLEALKVKPSSDGISRIAEADRFSNESWIRWRHRDYERSALDAEAAFALDPDNTRRLKFLIDGLADAAIELVDPGRQSYAGKPKQPIDPEKLEQSLGIARHGLDLLGLFYARAMKAPDWFKDQNGLSSTGYRIYLSKVVHFDEKTTPRSKELVADFIGEYRRLEFDVLGRGLEEQARSGRSFLQYTSWVASDALLDIFHHLSPVRPDWSQDAADVLTRWSEIADAQHPLEDKQKMRSTDYVLMTVHSSSRAPTRSEQDFQRLRQAYATLETRTDPLLKLHGRLLTLYLDRDSNQLKPEAAKKRVTDLMKDLEPYILREDGAAQDYETRRRWIDMAVQAYGLLESTDRMESSRKLLDLLESHGVYSSWVMTDVAWSLRSQKKQEDLLATLARSLAILEKKPAGMPANELQGELARLREWHRSVAETLGGGTGTVTPWESVRTLIDVQDAQTDIRSIVRPVVTGRTAYALGMGWNQDKGEVTFTLLRFNLDAKGGEPLSQFTIDKLPPGGFGQSSLENGQVELLTVIERSTSEGSFFIRSACVLGDRYYAATLGRGILSFPLKGGPAARLDEKQGLPSDYVQYLFPHDGWLYAWSGQPGKAAYLSRMKPDGSDVQIISSSLRTIQKTPLDNVTPVSCDFMTFDAPRNRIVFRLTNRGSDAVMGLWELSLKDLAVRQLERTHMILQGNPPRQISENLILIKHDFNAMLFDLKADELKLLVRGTGALPGNFLPMGVVGDKVWTGFPFGSLDVKTAKTEQFPSLRGAGKTFQPGVFFARTGEREYLMADPAALWVITLSK